jgi:hypothetical protein
MEQTFSARRHLRPPAVSPPRAWEKVGPTSFRGKEATVAIIVAQAGTVLWIIAAVLVIAGIVSLLRGEMVAGIVLIVLGLLVGPGGVSIFG